MLHYLLFGSYLAIPIALATPKKSRWTTFIHLFLALAMGIHNRYYAGIVFGVMICYEYRYGKILPYLQSKKVLGTISGILFLMAGIVTYLFLTILLFALSLACLHTVERLGDYVCKKLFS